MRRRRSGRRIRCMCERFRLYRLWSAWWKFCPLDAISSAEPTSSPTNKSSATNAPFSFACAPSSSFYAKSNRHSTAAFLASRSTDVTDGRVIAGHAALLIHTVFHGQRSRVGDWRLARVWSSRYGCVHAPPMVAVVARKNTSTAHNARCWHISRNAIYAALGDPVTSE